MASRAPSGAAPSWGKLISINADVHPNVSLSKSEIWFGRDASNCDVVFNDATVSKQHFRVYVDRTPDGKETALLDDRSSNGTYVDAVLVGKGNTVALRDGCIITLNVQSIDDKKFHKQSIAYLYLSKTGLETGFLNSITEEEMERIKKRLVDFQAGYRGVNSLFKEFQEASESANAKANQWLYKSNVCLAGEDSTAGIMQALYKIQNLRDEMTKALQHIQQRMVEFEERELDKSLQLFEEAKSATKEMGQYDKSMKKGDKKVSSSDLTKLEERLGEADKKNKLNTIAATLRMKEVDSKKFDTLNELLIDIVLKYADFFKKGSTYLSNVEGEMVSLKSKISKNLKEEEARSKQQINHLRLFSNANRREKQGYLQRKGKTVWFAVMDGAASYFKSWKASLPIGSIDLTLCSIIPDPKKKHTFELVTPLERISLQASSKADYEDWIKVLKNAIAYQIQMHNKLQEVSADKYKVLTNTLTFQSATIPPLAQIQMQSNSNSFCADCDNHEPDWVSTNWGVVICYECSGVHRSLGTHISKVRSLTLDKWEPQLLQLIKNIGNELGNKILEADMPGKYKKPRSDTPRVDRERYITAKYKRKRFVSKSTLDDETLSIALYDAVISASSDDSERVIPQILSLIAQGANVNWPNPQQQGSTVLHYSAASGNILCAELLVQNDANVSATDGRGWTPLFYAAQTDSIACARLLINRSARVQTTDMSGNTPLTIAKQNKSENVRMLLEGETNRPELGETPRV